MVNPTTLVKYLSEYAENETHCARQLLKTSKKAFTKKFVIVIPCYDEEFDFLARLQRHPFAAELLAIVVINEPDNDKGNVRNRALKQALHARSKNVMRERSLSLWHFGKLSILTIDRCHGNALPIKEGVGTARKIGADVACVCISEHAIQTPIIFSSDADTHLPENYFDIVIKHGTSAWVFAFRHIGKDPLLLQATRLYERQLQHLQTGLQKAGSPYAFNTLGSCLAVNAVYYAAVRGFPKRAAAEDFYLLNKLAKIGNIESLQHICMSIDARLSTRVPFGTGPAVAKIVTALQENQAITFYNPVIFTELGKVLSHINRIWGQSKHIHDQHTEPSAMDFSAASFGFSASTEHALHTIGLTTFLQNRGLQDKTSVIFEKRFHDWFDAFRTLKYIHYLRDQHYPNVSADALAPTELTSS